MNSWMIVERLENWCADRDGDFSTIGFPERYENRLSQLRIGDELIIYVASRISAFADIREISGTVARQRCSSEMLRRYDSVYPLVVQTQPKIVLDRNLWLPIKNLLGDLTFTRQLNDWRNAVRSTLRKLQEEDAKLIRTAMRHSACSITDHAANR